MPDSPAVFNHFGHSVTDLDRSSRFYCTLFGFVEKRRITLPDQPTATLLSVEPPVGLSAAYLEKDGAVLELLSFAREGNAPARHRSFTEPGLTHMSFCVDDIHATRDRVIELGGSDIDGTDIGVALFVRDPDGQPIELIGMQYRAGLD